MKNTLYINPLTPEICFSIFLKDVTITKTLAKNLDTASTFPKMLVNIVDEYDIDEIWCTNGPGPFTLMRVVTLSINALTYTRDIHVKSVHFFDLVANGHIPLIEANPREYLIRQDDEVMNIAKELLPAGTYEGIFLDIISTDDIKYIEYKENKDKIVPIFLDRPYETRISPIYFKPPHITTCSKA